MNTLNQLFNSLIQQNREQERQAKEAEPDPEADRYPLYLYFRVPAGAADRARRPGPERVLRPECDPLRGKIPGESGGE